MRTQTQRNAEPPPAVCPAHMIVARVIFYDPRKGYGRALTITGKRLRIPLQAMRDQHLVALEPGTRIFVELDPVDRTRVESLRLADS